jgi:SAM-dependent methyltransferase
MDKRKWDERYATARYAYGTNPNDFLVTVAQDIPQGAVLCLGEGEGRNAVFLAQHGFDVTAIDFSIQGLEKTRQLAQMNGVNLRTIETDLASFLPGRQKWDAIISIFCHLQSPVRKNLHKRCIEGLKYGGAFVLEAYSPHQLKFKTGGPKTVEFLASLRDLKKELFGLDFKIAHEIEREVWEGEYHLGRAAVVQLFGFRRNSI